MWGAIIGGAMGLMGANKQAAAMDKQNEAMMAGFNQYKPYVDANLEASEEALGGVLSTGAYSGPTYAGPNDFQTGTANTMGNIGGNMITAGNNMMNNTNSFGNNANDLYGQFQGMAADARQDRLNTAMDYAANNGQALVDAAMRDDRRNLQENTLTGIDLAASGSGNMNSSRAGVAEAVAQRSYDDRRADVAAGIQDRLIDRSLSQQAQQFSDQGTALNSATGANNNLMSAYNTGMNTLGEGANFGMNAGNVLQGFDQAQMNANMNDFDRMRDFELDKRIQYNQGILNRAPSGVQGYTANTVDPMQAAMGGAMQGFGFQQNYGQKISDGFNNIFRGRMQGPMQPGMSWGG